MISISEGIKIIEQNTLRLEAENTPLGAAVNKVLAEEIIADSDMPPFNRSQMDGYAIKARDVKTVPARLKIVGEAAAGNGWAGELKSGEAVRIMTGAAVPAGADAVQKLEVAPEENGFVEILETVVTGQNTVARASEIEKGTILFKPGETITRQMIASLASFGYAEVKVGKRADVAILATGNELVPLGKIPGEGQIRDSNTATLRAYGEAAGASVTTLENSVDDLANLKNRIQDAVQNCDLLILSGGVSVGKYDFTKAALHELGAKVFFDKVALRPGKPTVFAKLGETLIFGLPGNPVSVIVTFNLFVRIALLRMQGARQSNLKSGFAVLTKDLKGAQGRDSYLPAKLSTDENGRLLAEALKWGGSSDFVAFARADALVFVPNSAFMSVGSAAKILFLP